MNARRLAGRLLALALVGAALVFLGLTIARNAEALRDYDWSVDPLLLLVSVAAHVLVLAWGVVVWHRVLIYTAPQRVPLATLQHIWFVSGIARYIPGKIWQFVAAAQLAGRAGLSPAALLTSLAIQIGFTLLGALLVSVATLPLPTDWTLPRGALLVLSAAAAVLLCHPIVIRAALRLIPRALHRDVLAWSGSWSDSMVLLALSLVSWLIYGVAFWLFVASLIDVPIAAMLPLAGVNALSFLAGYAAFVVPAGIGVREAAMATLLGPIVPAYVGAALAILARLWTIAAELIGAAFFVLTRRRRAA